MAAIGECWNTASWVSTGGWAAGVWAGAGAATSSTTGTTSLNQLRVMMARLKKRREEQRKALIRRR